MQLLIQELSTRYPDRIIIIDSPPLHARSESSVLAKLVGQVVLIVEAESTIQNVVKEAIEQLKECEIVNMLLNKRHNRPGMSYHSGYYGY
jgi:Mrp family chromosome partitioning ATPase